MLIERARRGLNVVRLKGGDPFIFGRGGEEAEALAAAGVAFEIVPGVTSPLGIAAYTGVPLTHREHTKVVTFVTGHDAEGIDWSKIGTDRNAGHLHGHLRLRRNRARADRARPRRRYARHGRALGHAAGSANAGGNAGHAARVDPRARSEAARDDHHRRSGGAARQAELVRAPAAVRAAHRGDARPRAGRRALLAAARAGRGRDRIAHHRDSARPRLRCRSTRPSPNSACTTG